MTYFIIREGKKEGPFEVSGLRQMKVEGETLVWKQGFKNWRRARKVDDLKEIIYDQPPALVKSGMSAQAVLKILICHLFMGLGFYYVDKNVTRKFIYPVAAIGAIGSFILMSFRIAPFNSEFGLIIFMVSIAICYPIGLIDVINHYRKFGTRLH